jgi:hypothetical protein
MHVKSFKPVTQLKNLFLVVMLALGVFACKNDDEVDEPSGPTDEQGRVILEGDLATDRTLLANETYLLRGFVYVTNGATLTIEPGTIIMGEKATAGSLIVERGAKIIADGTQNRPIVFTSAQAAGSRNYGDWGGVVLIGKAPINRPEGTGIEGGIRGSFGGSDPNDNSGILRYVRIEFPGIPLSTTPNSEINGLTMYGVGAGTTIENVQVSFSGDDSFEWFGGTVNAKRLVAHRGFDDDFDTDFGYTGKVQFALSLRDPAYADQSSSNGFESDNYDPGTATGAGNGLPLTQPTFANVSILLSAGTPPTAGQGSGSYARSMHLRRNTAINIYNTLTVGYPEGLRLDGNATWANAQGGQLELKGIVLANNTTPLRAAVPTTGTAAETANFTNADVTTWFSAAGKGNSIIPAAELSTLQLSANAFSLTNPALLPGSGSTLLTGAVWDGRANDAFFEKVPYKGAFGTTDWTAGWTNFDPQGALY